jgi:hypothetical protein
VFLLRGVHFFGIGAKLPVELKAQIVQNHCSSLNTIKWRDNVNLQGFASEQTAFPVEPRTVCYISLVFADHMRPWIHVTCFISIWSNSVEGNFAMFSWKCAQRTECCLDRPRSSGDSISCSV